MEKPLQAEEIRTVLKLLRKNLQEMYRHSMVSGLVRHLPLTLLPDFRSSQAGERSFVPAFSKGKFNFLQVYSKFKLPQCMEIVPARQTI